jgi:hydrogenase expression/formation protein HypC
MEHDLMCLAIPGQVEEILVGSNIKMARVNFGGIKRSVCLQCVDAVVGDYVLVHVGFAISVIDEEEANRTLKMLEANGELAEFEEAKE